MSGHSKWSSIKRQKATADVKRGQIFTKLGNAITIAVREGGGGDPEANFKLRLAIEQARAANMPKENIQRAIERGLGKAGAGGGLKEVVYEGYGPSGVAIMIETVTDNRNRTTAEVKGVLERAGGSLGAPGSVAWMFAKEGVIAIASNGKSADDVISAAADAGAEDVSEVVDGFEIYTKPEDINKVKQNLENQGFRIKSFEISNKPNNLVNISDTDKAKQVLTLMEKLDALDEIQRVSANFDIPDSLLSDIQSS